MIFCCLEILLRRYHIAHDNLIIKKLPQSTIMQIASSVWKTGSRDIRDVLKIAKLCNPADTEQDINRLLAIHQKYRKTGREFNS